MTILCSATGCKSRMGVLTENGLKISFHRFPKNPDLKQKWVKNMRRADWNPSNYSRLCSLHFEAACYQEGLNRKVLHSYAVPTIFPNQTTLLEKCPKNRRIILKCANEASTSASQDENAEPRNKHCLIKEQVLGTSTDASFTSQEKLKKQLAHYKMLAERRGRKLKNLQRKYLRTSKKTANLEAIINELNSKLEADQMSILKIAMDVDNQIVSRYLMKVQGCSLPKEYPVEIKQFALTLQFLSPRAYDHVRTSFNTVLPHPKTLSRWYRVVDCQPGFTSESLETIQLRCAQSQKTLYAALCIDEMAIRKHIQWDGTKCYGYVDFGISAESCSDELPIATEVLTFMLTCVNEAWKIPVGYFMLNGLSGQQKHNLVTQCILLLNETGIKIIALTFDGAPSNAAMATQLGCDLNPENLVTHFKVEDQHVAI